MRSLPALEKLRAGRPWATNTALLVLGFALLLLLRQVVIEDDHFVFGFDHVSACSALAYLAAVAIVLTQPANRLTFPIILSFAVAFQAMVYFCEPFLSSDVFRYVWDGIVQHAHINPYRYVPGDPALTFLRTPHQDIFDNINRRDYARTIYPPVAQTVYWAVTFFSPTVEAMKLAMIGFLCAGSAALLALLRHMGRRREEILLYAWCPLLAWEIGIAGHVDAVVIAFICLALLFRYRNQPVWTGLFLGLAIFTKFYPAVLFPALYTRRDWKMPAMIAAVGVAGYSMYASAGKYVFGFLGGYSQEEGMNTGTRYFLLQLAQHVPGLHSFPLKLYLVLCAAVLGALTFWAWRTATVEVPDASGARNYNRPAYLRVAAAFAFALMLLFSPHYPWYILWLIPFLTLMPDLPLAAYLMGSFYLFTTALADPGPKMFLLNKILYGGVAVAGLLQFGLRRWMPARNVFLLSGRTTGLQQAVWDEAR